MLEQLNFKFGFCYEEIEVVFYLKFLKKDTVPDLSFSNIYHVSNIPNISTNFSIEKGLF